MMNIYTTFDLIKSMRNISRFPKMSIRSTDVIASITRFIPKDSRHCHKSGLSTFDDVDARVSLKMFQAIGTTLYTGKRVFRRKSTSRHRDKQGCTFLLSSSQNIPLQ
jgi:hypothetical protein